MQDIRFSYETVGNSSYLVATFKGGVGVVNYQLQMLVNNEIKNIVSANKRQQNDDVIVSYNITSKIALAQLDSKKRIPKLGLIKIIEGALAALEDIEEYQLVNSGIVFDEEYIYVKPGSYEPSFIYVPNSTDDCGIEPLKSLIISLIVGSKVEISNDNFVQILLDTLNNPALTVKDLKKICDDYKNEKPQKKEEPVKVDPLMGRRDIPRPADRPVVPPVSPVSPAAPPQNKKQPPVIPVPEDKKANSAQIIKFAVCQVVMAALLAAAILSGILRNEDGGWNLQYLLAVILLIGCADFVIYRELFKNNKADKAGKGKEKKTHSKKAAGKPQVAIPGMDIPSAVKKPQDVPKQQENIPVRPVIPVRPQPVSVQRPAPQQVHTPPTSDQSAYDPLYGLDTENTVVIDNSNPREAYLEYFENGLSTKIRLNKESVLVGKLRSQCDHVIRNNKISKVHAEFITRGTEHFVKDYNSTNGTYINGGNQRIPSNIEYHIFNGDRITLADIDLTFRC